MTREEAYKILTIYLKNKNLIKHCLAAEAVMRALAKELRFNPPAGEAGNKDLRINEEKWGITGLLHDADYELSKGHPEKHGLLLFDPDSIGIEKEPNKIPEDIAHAIKSHNYENTKVQPQSLMDWAITCCDQLTGLIVACALVHPDRKLASLTPEFILKRMKEKSFAKGADRKPILMCEEKLGILLKEFVEINLKAMQSISADLGL